MRNFNGTLITNNNNCEQVHNFKHFNKCFYTRTIFNSRWDNNRKQLVNNSSSRTLNEFDDSITINAKAGILPGGNNYQSVHKNSCYINVINQCDNDNNKVIKNKFQCINDVNNAKYDYDLQVHTEVCTTNSAGAQQDSRSAAGAAQVTVLAAMLGYYDWLQGFMIGYRGF
jgi:hypothetical protein